MKKAVLLILLLVLVASSVLATSFDEEIQKTSSYAQDYETGNINYIQLLLQTSAVGRRMNEALGTEMLTEAQLKPLLGPPTEKTKWIWVEDEQHEEKVKEDLAGWRKIIFDGKKIQIWVNAWPHFNRKEGENKLFYRLNLDVQFKKPQDELDISNRISTIKELAERFNKDPSVGNVEALAQASVSAEKAFWNYLQQSQEKCGEIMKSIFGSENKRQSQKLLVNEIGFYEGDDFEVVLRLEMCDECEGYWINMNLHYEGRGFKQPKGEPKMFFPEDYKDLSSSEFEREISGTLQEIKQSVEQGHYDNIYSGNSKLSALNEAWNQKSNDVWKETDKIYEDKRKSMSREQEEEYNKDYGWIRDEQEKRQKVREIAQKNYQQRKEFYLRLFSGYDKKEFYYEQEEYEKRLIEEFREFGEETCKNNADDNKNKKIDCEDEQCQGKICGRQSVKKSIFENNITSEIETAVDLYCIMSVCQAKEEIIEVTEVVCGNHLCEEGETNESCAQDCQVCTLYEPLNCSGMIMFSGSDENGCPLEPICLVQNESCQITEGCIQPLCGRAECVEGTCQISELTECREPECVDGQEKVQNCENGEQFLIEKCMESLWRKTGLACPEELLENVTENVTEENATESAVGNVSEAVSCNEYCASQPYLFCNGHLEVSGTYPDCRCEMICEDQAAGNECVVKEDCGNPDDVCSNGRCVTLPQAAPEPPPSEINETAEASETEEAAETAPIEEPSGPEEQPSPPEETRLPSEELPEVPTEVGQEREERSSPPQEEQTPQESEESQPQEEQVENENEAEEVEEQPREEPSLSQPEESSEPEEQPDEQSSSITGQVVSMFNLLVGYAITGLDVLEAESSEPAQESAPSEGSSGSSESSSEESASDASSDTPSEQPSDEASSEEQGDQESQRGEQEDQQSEEASQEEQQPGEESAPPSDTQPPSETAPDDSEHEDEEQERREEDKERDKERQEEEKKRQKEEKERREKEEQERKERECNDMCGWKCKELIDPCVGECSRETECRDKSCVDETIKRCEDKCKAEKNFDNCRTECPEKCLKGEMIEIKRDEEKHKEEKGVFKVGGSCRTSATKTEGNIYFDGWGDPFNTLRLYKQKYYSGGQADWCKDELESLVKQRKEFEAGFNEEFVKWFFEKYLTNSAGDWEQHVSGIFELYWKDVDNSRQMAERRYCLEKKELPEHKLINIKYETEYGKLEFWEEVRPAKIEGIKEEMQVISPYMKIWIFPPKEFIISEMRKAMKEHRFPGPPEEQGGGPTEEDRRRIRENQDFMEDLRSVTQRYGGDLDGVVRLVDNGNVVFNLHVSINEKEIIKLEPLLPEEIKEEDIRVELEFDKVYELIEMTEKEVQGGRVESPPWDKRPQPIQKVKEVYNQVKMYLKVMSLINSATITPKESEDDVQSLMMSFLKLMMQEDPNGEEEIEKDIV